MKTGIVDYGIGNLFSLEKACQKSSIPYTIVQKPSEIETCETLILPGVGAFPSAMKSMNSSGISDVLADAARQGKKIVGVCLGMQLLLSSSDEFGTTPGLNLIQGSVKKLPSSKKLKVPNIGWSEVFASKNAVSQNLKKIVDGNDFYFAHSFFCDVDDKYCVAYILRSDKRIPVLISDQKNIFGIQFHPEISGLNGANLFARIVKESAP